MTDVSAELDLDAIDRRILRELSRDGRLSNTQLAERVGLSPSPCWQRTRRLESEGYIRGYAAILDRERLRVPETVLVEVVLDRHDEHVLENFGRRIVELSEVIEVWLVSGEYDYILKVAVNGTRGYEDFLRKRLFRIPGIRNSRSCFALRCLKETGIPVPE